MLGAEGCPAPLYIHCDVTDVAALKAAVEQAIAAFGTIDVLVNNAANDQRHTIEEVTPEYWDRTLAINLRPHFFTIQAATAGHARRRPRVHHQHELDCVDDPHPPACPPTSRPRRPSWASPAPSPTSSAPHNIRVNAVLPGAIVTETTEEALVHAGVCGEILSRQAIKRHLVPEEVARLVLFLAADDSSAITNQSYIVDAGWV